MNHEARNTRLGTNKTAIPLRMAQVELDALAEDGVRRMTYGIRGFSVILGKLSSELRSSQMKIPHLCRLRF